MGVHILTVILLAWPGSDPHQPVLDAIRMVESGGDDACPDGDRGRSIGPFQISHAYWLDAIQFEPALRTPPAGIAGRDAAYQDCRDRAYAERVVRAYMKRYVPESWDAVDAEVIARTHNGGPRGARKSSTLVYWAKVRRQLLQDASTSELDTS